MSDSHNVFKHLDQFYSKLLYINNLENNDYNDYYNSELGLYVIDNTLKECLIESCCIYVQKPIAYFCEH